MNHAFFIVSISFVFLFCAGCAEILESSITAANDYMEAEIEAKKAARDQQRQFRKDNEAFFDSFRNYTVEFDSLTTTVEQFYTVQQLYGKDLENSKLKQQRDLLGFEVIQTSKNLIKINSQLRFETQITTPPLPHELRSQFTKSLKQHRLRLRELLTVFENLMAQ